MLRDPLPVATLLRETDGKTAGPEVLVPHGVTSFKKKCVLFVFGTRPEAIKLAPVIQAFKEDGTLEVRVCVTGQHRDLLDQVLGLFGIPPDIDLDLMVPEQTLPNLASKVIAACAGVFAEVKPDLVFVQGDTTSAFAAAFAASLCRIPVAHIEAGLRSLDKSSPFPEEINRVLVGHLADLHFAPSAESAANLRREGRSSNVHIVGNSVVDTLRQMLPKLTDGSAGSFQAKFCLDTPARKIVLVTLHRRESFGLPLQNICRAVRQIAEEIEGVEVIFPVHPNPEVTRAVSSLLEGVDGIRLFPPLTYAECIWLQCRASLVITDSGGILEEAVTLGVPVLIAREVTERVEAVSAGEAQLLGFDRVAIFKAAQAALAAGASQLGSPKVLRKTFGDGYTAGRIVRLSKEHLNLEHHKVNGEELLSRSA